MVLVERELFNVLQAFASLLPPSRLSFPAHLPASSIQAFLLDFLLLNPHFQHYPPSKHFQRSFWKWAISHLEAAAPDENFEEIDPRIYEQYLSLLPASALSLRLTGLNLHVKTGLEQETPPIPSFVTYFWKPPTQPNVPSSLVNLSHFETITLLESRTTIEGGTTGLRTWLASFILSQYLIDHPGLVRDKTVLELGSGIGFLGIIVTRLQQLYASDAASSTLWLTDVNEDVILRCRNNLQMTCNMSSQSCNINYRFLDWSDSLDKTKASALKTFLQHEIGADLILGADLIFDPTLIPALASVLHLALQPSRDGPPKTALIAATIRNEKTFVQFLQSVKERQLIAEEKDVKISESIFMQGIDEHSNKDVRIFKITLRCQSV